MKNSANKSIHLDTVDKCELPPLLIEGEDLFTNTHYASLLTHPHSSEWHDRKFAAHMNTRSLRLHCRNSTRTYRPKTRPSFSARAAAKVADSGGDGASDPAGWRLQVSPGTLSFWRSTERYQIPFIKDGRLVRYRLSDLNSWLESRIQANGVTA